MHKLVLTILQPISLLQMFLLGSKERMQTHNVSFDLRTLETPRSAPKVTFSTPDLEAHWRLHCSWKRHPLLYFVNRTRKQSMHAIRHAIRVPIA